MRKRLAWKLRIAIAAVFALTLALPALPGSWASGPSGSVTPVTPVPTLRGAAHQPTGSASTTISYTELGRLIAERRITEATVDTARGRSTPT